jgi:luciferase family oxidoreductase group 1
MKLSILDQAPISANQTAKEALEQSVLLAQAGERLGYTRYWIAEHHDMPGLACPAPEVMLPYIGARTNKIRIGSGAVLLPHYKPYKVAEIYNMLSTLFPGRIDIGIGRAPGGSAEVTSALSDNFLQNVWKMPVSLRELLYFINDDHEEDRGFAKITASPLPEVRPEQWLLGTSNKSALLAAEYGMAYAFGLFMSEKDAAEILQSYYESFKPGSFNVPQSILTVSAICAETTEQAEEIALSTLIWGDT